MVSQATQKVHGIMFKNSLLCLWCRKKKKKAKKKRLQYYTGKMAECSSCDKVGLAPWSRDAGPPKESCAEAVTIHPLSRVSLMTAGLLLKGYFN